MEKKKKNQVYKNQKYKANESTSKQPKEKTNANNQQKNKEKILCKWDPWLQNDNQQQRRFKTRKLSSTANWLATDVHYL